jgi:hypothetical protein
LGDALGDAAGDALIRSAPDELLVSSPVAGVLLKLLAVPPCPNFPLR